MLVEVYLHGALANKGKGKHLEIQMDSPQNKDDLISKLTQALGFDAKKGIILKVNGESIFSFFKTDHSDCKILRVDMYLALAGG